LGYSSKINRGIKKSFLCLYGTTLFKILKEYLAYIKLIYQILRIDFEEVFLAE